MYSKLLKILPVAGLLALLVACGGGEGGAGGAAPDAPEPPQIPWASPAYIVPVGAASKTIELSGCIDRQGFNTAITASSATLVVTSDGDMIFSAALNGATTVGEVLRINYANATEKVVRGENGSGGPSADIELIDTPANKSLRATTKGTRNFNYYDGNPPGRNISCSLAQGTTAFALTRLPTSARVAKMMTSGITGIDTQFLSSPAQPASTFTGGVATWDNWESPGLYTEPENLAARYISLDVNTGAIGSSASPAGPFNTTAITIPTAPTSRFARFREDIYDGNKGFFFELQRDSGVNLVVLFERVSNLLRPSQMEQGN